MSEPFIGEIKIISYSWAPDGWALCDGSIISVNQNQALFSLLGVTYGGNGSQTFGLPDLRGRNLTGRSSQTPIGSKFGEEEHVLTIPESPAHTHPLMASSEAPNRKPPRDNLFATPASINLYADPATANGSLFPATVSAAGGGQPHDNQMPFLVVNYCIATEGIYPPRP